MDILEKKVLYNILFDFYGGLLTDKQQQYFKKYYFEDYTLSEIASSYNVSRSAIHDQLHKIYNILEEYEQKLQLYKKHQIREKLFDECQTKEELIKKLKEVE